jgi:hypothetical protein
MARMKADADRSFVVIVFDVRSRLTLWSEFFILYI